MIDALKLQMDEEQFHYEVLKIERNLGPEARAIIRRLSLDRNSLLIRVKLIAEALESDSEDTNSIEEVAKWAREAYERMVLRDTRVPLDAA